MRITESLLLEEELQLVGDKRCVCRVAVLCMVIVRVSLVMDLGSVCYCKEA
jgi:hypothetical protein